MKYLIIYSIYQFSNFIIYIQQHNSNMAQSLELDIDLYFWMIDRGDLQDDQRNQVNMQKQKVKLHREHSQRLLNGVYIGKLMHAMRKIILKKSKKPFTLDPVLQNLKDQSVVNAREYNWNFLATELRKFSVRLTKDQKNQIIYDVKQSLVIDVLQQLHQYDLELAQSKDGLVGAAGPAAYDLEGARAKGQSGAQSTVELPRVRANRAPREAAQRGSSLRRAPSSIENNSEINYGVNNNAIERSYGRKHNQLDIDRPDSHLPGPLEYQNDILKGDSLSRGSKVSVNSKSAAYLDRVNNYGSPKLRDGGIRPDNPLNSGAFDGAEAHAGAKQGGAAGSLIQLHPMKAPSGPDDEDDVDGGLSKVLDDIGYNNTAANTDPSYEAGAEDNIYDSVVNQSIDPQANSLLLQSETVATFVFNSLKLGMGIDNGQVAQLLQQNFRFLILLCVRGNKGGDYRAILDWYSLVINNVELLVNLLRSQDLAGSQEGDQVAKALNVLRCGLFSKSSDVVNICCRFFTKFRKHLNDNAQDGDIQQLMHAFWDWLSFEQSAASTQSPARPQQQSPGKLRGPRKASNTQKQERDQFLQEQGMKSFLRAFQKQQGHIVEQFCAFLIVAGTDNYVELFMRVMREASPNQHQYLGTILEFYEVLCKTQGGKRAFIQSGVFNQLLDMGLQMADEQLDAPLNEMAYVQERQVALILLVDFWKTRPDIVQAKENRGRLTEGIQQVLMRGCRDRLKIVSMLSVSLMVALLDQFARDRNENAPILYKALTFIFIEQYNNMDLREEVLHNFIKLFKTYQGMPINILCDPLLKQIQLNLDKQESIDGAQNILQPISNFFTLNTTDFEFFLQVAVHPKLQPETAVELLRVVLKVSRINIIFTRVSLKMTLTILNRFENNQSVYEFCQQHVRDMMRLIENQDLAKVNMYNRLMKDPKTHFHSKRKSIVSKSINQSSEIPAFSNILSSKNTKNIKYQAAENRLQGLANSATLDKSTSIKSSVAGGNDIIDLRAAKGGVLQDNSNTIEDSDLQQILNPNLNQEDSSFYMQMLTNEKMIINQLQCFIGTGIKVLVDFIRQQTLQTYTRIEKKYRLRNKGLYHLLKLMGGETNVVAMLAMYQQELNKQRADKIRQRKEREELERKQKQDQLESLEYQGGDGDIPIKLDDQDLRLPQIKIKNELTQKPIALRNQINLKNRGRKQSSNKNNQTVELEDTPDIYGAVVPAQKYSTPLRTSVAKRKLGEPVQVVSLRPPGHAYDQVKLFNLSEEVTQHGCPADEISKYLTWLKVNAKLYRAMYAKYSNMSKNKQPNQKLTFDQVRTNQESLSLSEVYAFLTDFKLTPANLNGLKRDQIKRIIKLVNIKQENHFGASTSLDFHGFLEFILQMAYHFSAESIQRPSIFLPILWQHMKERSFESVLPLFQRLFEDPYSSSIGDPVILEELARKVNDDPDFVLPAGFLKYKKDVFVQEYRAPDNLDENVRMAVELLDEVVVGALGMHILRPELEPHQVWGVKPDIFQQKLKKNTTSKHKLLADQYGDKEDNDSSAAARRESQQKSLSLRRESRITDTGRPTRGKSLGLEPDSPSTSDQIGRSRPLVKKRTLKSLGPSSQSALSPGLRLVLLQKENSPDLPVYQETAAVLADMTKVLEQGLQYDVPLDQIRRKYVVTSAARMGSKAPKNKIEARQAEKQTNEQLAQARKLMEFLKHDQQTKAQLEKQRIELAQKQKELKQQAKEEARRQKELKDKKEKAKKQYYASIQQAYVQETLPGIVKNDEAQKEKERQERLAQKSKREKAAQQVERDIKSMREVFDRQRQGRQDVEQQKRELASQQRQQLARRNERLARSFVVKKTLRGSTGAASVDAAKGSYQSAPGKASAQIRDLGQPSDTSIESKSILKRPTQRTSNTGASKSTAKLSSQDSAPAVGKPPVPQQRNLQFRDQASRPQARPTQQSPTFDNSQSAYQLPLDV